MFDTVGFSLTCLYGRAATDGESAVT
ncbi:hypothetical protein HNR73_000957 [Phytomonospora endophytica]|uniref:Uncharacterized protein n=1 Tax=Phytomonospora endophytica TaxID=714109 RepID=A0A841FMD7_9ACTN|nr:hypothetical protein [Phytomonospora endophytica]